MDAISQGSQEQDEVPHSLIASIAEAHPDDLQNKDPAVIEDLRGNYKLLVNRQLPTVLDWLKVVIRVRFCPTSNFDLPVINPPGGEFCTCFS